MRLKRSVEVFEADRSLYLLHGALGDFRIADHDEVDRQLIGLLSQGYVAEDAIHESLAETADERDRIAEGLRSLDSMGLLERRGDPAVLSAREHERFDRQLIYFSDLAGPGDGGERAQRRLRDSTVLILGCGGLGSWTACALGCAGMGSMVLVDDDSVELSNLNRQLLFGEADVGRPKVAAAAEALLAHDATLDLVEVRRRICGSEDLAPLLDGVDLLISTADWPAYELPRWVNRACMEAAVPFITAGQAPPLVRVGPMTVPGRTACFECQERAIRRSHPLYERIAEHRDSNPTTAATIGAASGVVGSILAMEAIHLLGGRVAPASIGTASIIDLRTLEMRQESFRRDPGCPICSEVDRLDPASVGTSRSPGRGRPALSGEVGQSLESAAGSA